jgi:hypothetical protein
MGYSASTLMKSAKARDQMLAFLAEHYRPWHQVQPEYDEREAYDAAFFAGAYEVSEDWDWTAYICSGDDLAYNSSKNKIGFNFSGSGEMVGHYGFTLLRWMALMAGAERKVNKKEFPSLEGQRVPVMQYDYDPCWPVLVGSPEGAPDDTWWCHTDEHARAPPTNPSGCL